MRNAFIEELVSLARDYPQIALVIGDIGYSVIEPFADEFPERFINAGIAEQNMAGLAAGMASEGYHVFTYSIANFPSFRCAEQIRNDITYHKLPVTVVAVGGGLAYGNLGYSHHAVQDYALMRTMPNMLISAPGDPMEVRACVRYLVENPQPSYLRLGKAGEPCFHSEIPEVSPGKWLMVRKGQPQGNTYLTTGATLEFAHQLIAGEPEQERWSINSLPMWDMTVKQAQIPQIEDYAKVLTVEDHLMDGGFGGWLLEAAAISPDLLTRIQLKSLDPKVCGMVGKQSTLNAEGGLS